MPITTLTENTPKLRKPSAGTWKSGDWPRKTRETQMAEADAPRVVAVMAISKLPVSSSRTKIAPAIGASDKVPYTTAHLNGRPFATEYESSTDGKKAANEFHDDDGERILEPPGPELTLDVRDAAAAGSRRETRDHPRRQ